MNASNFNFGSRFNRGRFGHWSDYATEIEKIIGDIIERADIRPPRNGPIIEDIKIPVDFREIGNEFVLSAEVPGLEASDINIDFKDGYITLKGEKKNALSEEKDGWLHQECLFGSFTRKVAVPENAMIENASAEIKNGILKLTIPKKEDDRDKGIKIEIKNS